MGTGNVETPIGNGNLIIKKVSASEAPNNGVVLEFGNSTSWVGQLYIGDNATQGIYYNGWSNGTRGSWRRLADVPVSLFDNASGTSGNVELSESSANFSYIEIISKRNSNYYSSGKIYSPNGKSVALTTSYSDEANMYFYSKRVDISGSNITVARSALLHTNGSNPSINCSADGNYIVKVIGYR